MIPSRPLTVFEILAETFKIYKRTFWRTMLLQCMFVVPCALLVIAGLTNISNSVGDVLSKQNSLSDAQVTTARNTVLLAMERKDPGAIERMRKLFHESSTTWDAPLRAKQDTLTSNAAGSSDDTSAATATTALDSAMRGDGLQMNTNRQVKKTILDLLSSSSFINGWIWIFLGTLLFFIAANAPVAGATDLASRSFEERPTTLSLIWGPLFKRNLWMVLAFQLALGVLFGAVSILRLPLMMSPHGLGLLFLFFLFSMAGTVAMIYFLMRFTSAIPSIISEDLNLIEGFKRSWNLTCGHVWRILGATMAFGLIITVVVVIFLVAIMIIAAPQFIELMKYVLFAEKISIAPIMHGISSLVWICGLAYLVPIILIGSMSPVFTTVLYYDLRTRHDGPLNYDDEVQPVTPIYGSIQTT
jgi:hypothetical protein